MSTYTIAVHGACAPSFLQIAADLYPPTINVMQLRDDGAENAESIHAAIFIVDAAVRVCDGATMPPGIVTHANICVSNADGEFARINGLVNVKNLLHSSSSSDTTRVLCAPPFNLDEYRIEKLAQGFEHRVDVAVGRRILLLARKHVQIGMALAIDAKTDELRALATDVLRAVTNIVLPVTRSPVPSRHLTAYPRHKAKLDELLGDDRRMHGALFLNTTPDVIAFCNAYADSVASTWDAGFFVPGQEKSLDTLVRQTLLFVNVDEYPEFAEVGERLFDLRAQQGMCEQPNGNVRLILLTREDTMPFALEMSWKLTSLIWTPHII